MTHNHAAERGHVADETAYVALGSNVGDRARHLETAVTRLRNTPGVYDVRVSRVEETAPLGPVDQGAYLNQMVAFRTTLAPHALLSALHDIEHAGGRERTTHWGPRTIDLDIVMFERTRVRTDNLIVPHPQIANRDFWQRELFELGAPGFTVSTGDQPIPPPVPTSL